MPLIREWCHLGRIAQAVKPQNTDKLLTVNQARKVLNRESKFVTKAMRDGNLNYFFIRTKDMDFFFIKVDEKFEKLRTYVEGNNFDYKRFKLYLQNGQ